MSGAGRGLVIYGAGGHGRVIADAARAAGWALVGFADDDPGKRDRDVDGVPVIATGWAELAALCQARGAAAVCGLGDNELRRRGFEALRAASVALASVIHPAAVIAPSATLGLGCVVLAGAIVNPGAQLGDDVIINTAASVDHDSQVGDHAHLSPGVHTGGTVTIGAGAHLGVGASVRDGVAIGAWSVIGVGAAVVGDIPAGVVAYGNPARVVRAHPRRATPTGP